MPFTEEPPTLEATATNEPIASPTVAPGSFEDFHLFAAEIDTALHDRNTSFFEERAVSSVWNCLGEETLGICKGVPADTTLQGIPVTYDWTTYEVYGREDYTKMWQTRFDSRNTLKLVALAHQFGDNPLLPMAREAFFAIVSVAEQEDPSSIQEVRVLLFEYYEDVWHLPGEFVTVEHMDSWLRDSCSACYDRWAAWQD